MKVLKTIIISLIIIGMCSIVVLTIYLYRSHRMINLSQRNTKNNIEATPLTASTEIKAQRQAEVEKAVHKMDIERLQLGSADAAATIGPTKELEEEILKMLKSNKWGNAVAIIQGLLYHYKWSPDRFSVKIRNALVDILERELAKQKPPYTVGQEMSDMDILTQDICGLYNPRAIPLLIKLNMISCLSLYGDKGAEIILSTTTDIWTQTASEKLEATKLIGEKTRILGAIGGFTNSPTTWNSLSATDQSKVKSLLLKAIKDPNYHVRLWAVRELSPIANKKDIRIIEELAKKDPERKGSTEHPFYPVREEAEKALEELKAKGITQ